MVTRAGHCIVAAYSYSRTVEECLHVVTSRSARHNSTSEAKVVRNYALDALSVLRHLLAFRRESLL
jgi:hypothetical protein